MSTGNLDRVEEQMRSLTLIEQLQLLESLAREIRVRSDNDAARLDAMAADPAVRREIEDIEQEFSDTEWDGLPAQP